MLLAVPASPARLGAVLRWNVLPACVIYAGGNYYWCRDSGSSLRLEEGSVVLETVQMIKKTSC